MSLSPALAAILDRVADTQPRPIYEERTFTDVEIGTPVVVLECHRVHLDD